MNGIHLLSSILLGIILNGALQLPYWVIQFIASLLESLDLELRCHQMIPVIKKMSSRRNWFQILLFTPKHFVLTRLIFCNQIFFKIIDLEELNYNIFLLIFHFHIHNNAQQKYPQKNFFSSFSNLTFPVNLNSSWQALRQ